MRSSFLLFLVLASSQSYPYCLKYQYLSSYSYLCSFRVKTVAVFSLKSVQLVLLSSLILLYTNILSSFGHAFPCQVLPFCISVLSKSDLISAISFLFYFNIWLGNLQVIFTVYICVFRNRDSPSILLASHDDLGHPSHTLHLLVFGMSISSIKSHKDRSIKPPIYRQCAYHHFTNPAFIVAHKLQ